MYVCFRYSVYGCCSPFITVADYARNRSLDASFNAIWRRCVQASFSIVEPLSYTRANIFQGRTAVVRMEGGGWVPRFPSERIIIHEPNRKKYAVFIYVLYSDAFCTRRNTKVVFRQFASIIISIYLHLSVHRIGAKRHHPPM